MRTPLDGAPTFLIMLPTLQRLQNWYQAHCNGAWEHKAGVTIETLDNPGWSVRIQLAGTSLEGREFTEISDMDPDSDWIRCWLEDSSFLGVGGPRQLERILTTFLDWAEAASD